MWWSRSLVLSHNKLLNFILSNRGGGKTFDSTRWCIDDFKKTGKQGMWCRRYDTELTGEKGILTNGKFFDNVTKVPIKNYPDGKIPKGAKVDPSGNFVNLYPDDTFEVDGYTGKINGEVAIHFVALSTSRQLKSANFPLVNKLILDEFLIGTESKVGYLKNEVEVLLDLIETVDRMRDEVRVLCLANSISIVNPYFLYFHIKPSTSKRFTVYDEICVEMFTDQAFVEKKKQTRFGRLVSGTRYGDYAIDNKWLMDNETFIAPKPPKAEFMLAMKYQGTFYGFWVDYNEGLIYVNRQYDPSSYSLYCLTKEDHEANLLLVKTLGEQKRVQRIVFAFRNGLLRFEDMQVKNQFYEFIGFFVR